MKAFHGEWFCYIGMVCACILLSGCAEVVIEKNGQGKGYDVYRPEPYLLVFKQTSSTTTVVTDKAADAGGGGGTPGGTPSDQSGGGKDGGGSSTSPEGLSGPGVTVIWLPNYSERYRVSSSAFFLSKAGAEFTIRDGWMLTGVTDQSDNTALLTAAQGVLSSALGTASSAAKTAKSIGATPAPGGKTSTTSNSRQDWELYKFLFDKHGNFYGLVQVTPEDKSMDDFRKLTSPLPEPTLAPQRAPTYRGKDPTP